MSRNFANDDHALHLGLLAGYLMKAGVDVRLSIDGDGDYQQVLMIYVEGPEGTNFPVYVQVLPAEQVTIGGSDPGSAPDPGADTELASTPD